jgi:hypothetical protein
LRVRKQAKNVSHALDSQQRVGFGQDVEAVEWLEGDIFLD